MVRKLVLRSLIVGSRGQRDIGEVHHPDLNVADSWNRIPPRESRHSKGSIYRNGVRRTCSILPTLLFMGTVSAFGGEGKAPMRLPPRTVPSAGTGIASWYGHPYHGRRAADGRIYDMHKLTAAHQTLPLGTRVRVHSLENARTVEVSITDRGPFVDGRLIDLSFAAAQILGMNKAGVARVWLEVLSVPIRFASRGRVPVSQSCGE